MGYNNHAFAVVKNLSGIALSNVYLSHQYSDDEPETGYWSSLPAGGTSSPMQVNYNTGFIRTGQDYWSLHYKLPDGSLWKLDGWLMCTLHDDNSGKTVTLTIKGSCFSDWNGSSTNLTLQSGQGYNTWAAISLVNNFPVSVSATLKHKYSDDSSYQKKWDVIPACSTAAEMFIAYYNTGFIRTGSDHWNLQIQLNIPPYDNQPANAFGTFGNSNPDKGCMLESGDNGNIQTFTMDGSVFTMGIGSGSCTDSWNTWNGYNTLAFLRVQNQFSQSISTVTLTHQYSGDTIWSQTRGLILPQESSGLMVVEYNTGFGRTGSDYWTVYAYLEGGTWYQNHKAGKGCMLRTADATNPLTFQISPDTFNINLPSGSCTDSMDDKGSYSVSMGRDANQPYNKNAFVGSHNAYANFAEGYWYAQQSAGLQTQLALGGTTLLLDIWYDNNDIYLMHEGMKTLQPFNQPQKLSSALATIALYLRLQHTEPVTIVFEDRVGSQYQNLIKQAFLDSVTWGLVFNADSYNVRQRGWPTLSQLFSAGTPLVVFTSNPNSSDFAYQWNYMSENVYGDASLDSNTWMNPRGESQPLSSLFLCALNHFPTWSVSGFVLSQWISRANSDNATALLKTMIDACNTRWGRYPNWINADFWEVPDGGLAGAVYYMNQKLQGKTVNDPMVVRHGRVITQELDHSQLIQGDFKSLTNWIDRSWDKLCPRPGATEIASPHQLDNLVNLSLVLGTLTSRPLSQAPFVELWVKSASERIQITLQQWEEPLLQTFKTGQEMVWPYAIPYLFLTYQSGMNSGITSWIKDRMQQAPGSSSSLDSLFLALLAGKSEAGKELDRRLAQEQTRLATSTPLTLSQAYNYTHELLYNSLLGRETGVLEPAKSSLAQLTEEWMPKNADLGAELLACYWLSGGEVTQSIRQAVRQLKTSTDQEDADCGSALPEDHSCLDFKEVIHHKLTAILGLGLTLCCAGEVLEQPWGAKTDTNSES